MTIIGLTGGIAAGKSTAAEMLREFGATVIDADRLGHRSYEPGTPGFQKVVNAFGHDIVGKDGAIDRRVLGGKVFGAPGQLERLNAIVWPEIRLLIQDEIKQIRSQEADPVIVLEAAVLLEANWQDLCDEVWVVLTPVKTAVERLRERNGLSPDAAMARINAQMSNKEREALSDVKIENASDEEALHQRVERAWKALITRRGGKKPSGAKATKTGSVKAAKPAARTTKPAAAAKAAAPKTTAKASVAKPAAKPATKAAAAKPATKPAAKAASAKPAKAAPAKPTTKAAVAKPTTKAAVAKPTTKAAVAKPTTKAAVAKPAAKAPAKTATSKPAAKAAPKATAKSAATAAPKKPAAKAAGKSTAKPATARSK
ncbi:MAG: dephospho-CoA kinase [Dehalococcoidia bacterium]